jgi:hypothetical protein
VSLCVAVVTDIWRTESGRSQRFTEPLALGFRCPTALGGEPARLPEYHWSVEGPAHGIYRQAGKPGDIGVRLRTDHAGQEPAIGDLRMGGRT